MIYDNRCQIHCATWHEAARYRRSMWRTTVWGNPGPRGGWLTVYILAPILGAIIGGGIYKAYSALMPQADGDSPDEAPK